MLFDSLIKPALDSVNSIINDFHLSPEDKAKATQALAEATERAAESARDYDAKLNDIAGQNIRAETSSADRFAARARPSFMYVIISVLGFNYIALPFFQVFGSHVGPIILPADLLTLFGVCVTGYSVSRSLDKALALPGETSINILGLKASNKS